MNFAIWSFVFTWFLRMSLLNKVTPFEPCFDLRNCLVFNGIPVEFLICGSESPNSSGNYNYTFLNYQWNLLIPQIFPMGYFLPESALQIQRAVKCCRLLKISLVAKSGGHSYAKYSFGNSKTLVVDLQKMTTLSIDSEGRTAQVGPGFLSGPLAQKLYDNGRFFIPNGLCPTVGISYALGGGYSFLSRRYGLVQDSILELEMVDADGHLLTTNSVINNDLFWALRGAGGGSFGIVTRYKFKVRLAPNLIVYGRKSYEISQFPQVFDGFQRYSKSNPSKAINIIMTSNRTTILIEVINVLPRGSSSPSRVTKILERRFPSSRSPAEVLVLNFKDYLATVGAYGGDGGDIGNVTRHDYGPIYFHGTSFYVRKTIGTKGIREVNALIQKTPDFVTIEYQMNGGAINDVQGNETSYVHRKQNIYKINADYLGGLGRTKEEEKASLDWQRDFFDLTRKVMHHTESYQNNADPQLLNYLDRYYGENLDGLIRVKRKYDPTNFYKNPQSIPTT